MKQKIKSQNGAISLFVLLSMMFLLAFMFGAFSLVNKKNVSQIESLKETKRIYSEGESASDRYDAIFSSNNSTAVPISNIAQLKEVRDIKDSADESEVKYLTTGYTYSKSANYYLQNDIILDLENTIDKKNNLQDILLDYVLYNDKYNVDLNGHSIYYQKDDGSIWKIVCYQNIGDTENPNVFSSNPESIDYYGKSYYKTNFSILDEGISAYSRLWDTYNDIYKENFEFLLAYNNNDSYKFNIKDTKEYDVVTNYGLYNRWRQTNNPTKEEETTTGDGTAVALGYTHDFEGGTAKLAGYNGNSSEYSSLSSYSYWGGLTKSSENGICYLDGAVGNSSYYFPIGFSSEESLNEGKIPILTSTETNKTATECILLVRYK